MIKPFRNTRGLYRFVVKAKGNNAILLTSGVYTTVRGLKKGIKSAQVAIASRKVAPITVRPQVPVKGNKIHSHKKTAA